MAKLPANTVLMVLVLALGQMRTGGSEIGAVIQTFHFRSIVKSLESIVEDLVLAETADESTTYLGLPETTAEPNVGLLSAEASNEALVDEDLVFSPKPALAQKPAKNETDAFTRPLFELTIVGSVDTTAMSAVIVLHGINSTAKSLLPFVELVRNSFPSTRFILPQAASKFLVAYRKKVPAWYDILSVDGSKGGEERGVKFAAREIDKIARLQATELGIRRDKISVVGISQGGAVALTCYMRYEWASAIGISSFLPLKESYPKEMTDTASKAPLLMLHGSKDQTTPASSAQKTVDFVEKLGRAVDYIEFPGETHELVHVIDDVVAASVAQLRLVLS